MSKEEPKLKKILVVEDVASLRKFVKAALTTEEWEVFEAENPKQAKRLLKFIDFDLLLLDINMPGQTGLEFLREIRNEGINTPVIMFTSSTDRADVEEAISLNISDYLKKTTKRDDLVERVRKVLLKSKV